MFFKYLKCMSGHFYLKYPVYINKFRATKFFWLFRYLFQPSASPPCAGVVIFVKVADNYSFRC